MNNSICFKTFLIMLAATFVIFGCDKKKKIPIIDDNRDRILQQEEDSKLDNVIKPEEGIIAPVIIGYENGVLSWNAPSGPCSDDDITYYIFISANENPTEKDFLGGYITLKNVTEKKIKLDFGKNDVLYIFIVAVDKCNNRSEMSEPLAVERPQKNNNDEDKNNDKEKDKEKPKPKPKDDNKKQSTTDPDQDQRVIRKLVQGLKAKAAGENTKTSQKTQTKEKSDAKTKTKNVKKGSKIDKNALLSELNGLKASDKSESKKGSGLDKKALINELKGIKGSEETGDGKNENHGKEISENGEETFKPEEKSDAGENGRSDIMAFTPELAVNLAMATPLRLVKKGMFKNDTIQSCLYKNQDVLVVDGLCSKREMPAVEITVYSLDLGMVRVYSEPGSAPSKLHREDYNDDSWSISWKLPKKNNLSAGSPTSDIQSFDDLESLDNLCLSTKESCVIYFKDDAKKVSCRGVHPEVEREWSANASTFWDNPTDKWYQLIKYLIELR